VGCYLPANTSRSNSDQSKSSDKTNLQFVSLKTKVVAVVLLLSSCWLITYIAPIGLASAYYFKANYYLELWQRKPQTLDLASWQEAADAIEKAIELHPKHPHYLLILAKINEWAWYKGLKTADQILVNDQLYKLAIELRPGWTNAYADYAYYLGIVNFRVSEAFAQLEKARKYGPYTAEVFQRTLLIAGAHWPLLNGDQKVLSFLVLAQMVKNSRISYQQALQIGQDHKLLRPFCIYLRLKHAEFTTETNKLIDKDFCQSLS
jgi:tetratricopeptide (TPR) repeat protein